MKYLTLLVLLLAGIDSMASAYDIPAPGSTSPRRPARTTGEPLNANSEKPDQQPEESKAGEIVKKLAAAKPMWISVEKLKGARLVIPISIIRELQANDGKANDGKSSSAIPATFNDPRIIAPRNTISRWGTVMGGLLLAMAVLFGGLWLLRSRKVPNFAAVALVIAISSAATASFVYANVGPPPEARSLTSKILKYSEVFGEVKIETTDRQEYIQLVLPPE